MKTCCETCMCYAVNGDATAYDYDPYTADRRQASADKALENLSESELSDADPEYVEGEECSLCGEEFSGYGWLISE